MLRSTPIRLAVLAVGLVAAVAAYASPTARANAIPVISPSGSPGSAGTGASGNALGIVYDVTCTGSGYGNRGIGLNSQRAFRSPASNVKQDIWMQATLYYTYDFNHYYSDPKPWRKKTVDPGYYLSATFDAEGWPQTTRSAYFLVQVEFVWANTATATTPTKWLGGVTNAFTGYQPFNAQVFRFPDTGDGTCWLF